MNDSSKNEQLNLDKNWCCIVENKKRIKSTEDGQDYNRQQKSGNPDSLSE